MKCLTYLFVDLGSIAIPFLFSFHPRIRFDKVWRSYFIANMFIIIPFLIWDVVFTKYGIWGFNPDYLCGVELFGLPLEEYLFFICIPYACLFTYFSLKKLWSYKFITSSTQLISLAILLLSILMTSLNYEKAYTLSTFSFLTLLMILVIRLRFKWINHFYFSYLILLIPFFITNGILTGSGLEKPIVWYNDIHNLGIRLGTIPIEDVFYGLSLMLGIAIVFEYLMENKILTK
jgi:lycopene cyclase domain-containing protein